MGPGENRRQQANTWDGDSNPDAPTPQTAAAQQGANVKLEDMIRGCQDNANKCATQLEWAMKE